MRMFAHVIAELNFEGSWSAWFRDTPQDVCNGHNCACAVAILIDVYGSPILKWDQIVVIDETTRDDHAEFLVPYGNRRTSPVAMSVN